MNLSAMNDNTLAFTDVNTKLEEIAKGLAANNDLPLYKAISMLSTETLTTAQKAQLAAMYGMDSKAVSSAILATKRNEGVIAELGSVPANEYEYVKLQLEKWKVEMNFQEMFMLGTPLKYEGTEISDELFADLSKENQARALAADPKIINMQEMWAKLIKASAYLELRFQEKQLMNALDDWRMMHKNKLISDIIGSVVYDPKCVAQADVWWDVLVNAITTTNVEETKIVLQQWMYNVKRKMFGNQATDHIMPVLGGKQGIGKSTLINRLTSPIGEFVASTDFQTITDNRAFGIWSNYVLVFDEMGYSTTSNIESIKRLLTEHYMTGRPMGTNKTVQIRNCASFIGSTNKDLGRLIFDDTGMRRFYQIQCEAFDQTVINSIDYEMLWKSIDENAATGPLKQNAELWRKVEKVQNEKRHRTPLEVFLSELERPPGSYKKYLNQALYEEYKLYEEATQARADMDLLKMGRNLKDAADKVEGLTLDIQRSNGKTWYHFTWTDVEGE